MFNRIIVNLAPLLYLRLSVDHRLNFLGDMVKEEKSKQTSGDKGGVGKYLPFLKEELLMREQ